MEDTHIPLANGGSATTGPDRLEFFNSVRVLQAGFDRSDFVRANRQDSVVQLFRPSGSSIEVTTASEDNARLFESIISVNVPSVIDIANTPVAVQRASAANAPTLITHEDFVRSEVEKILTSDEQIVCIAHQDSRAPVVKKAAAVATTHRLILFRPAMLGSFNFWDSRWADIQDVHLNQGMMFSELVVRKVNNESISIDKLSKAQGRDIYSVCQQKEYEWKERRRQRQMEEDRAKAGGVTLNQGFMPPQAATSTLPNSHSMAQEVLQPSPASVPPEDPIAKLSQAKRMLDLELISQQEFDEVKRRILESM